MPAAVTSGDVDSVSRYIRVPQDIRFNFQFFQPLLDDIADADDADKFAVGKDGQMPHAVICHQAHSALQAIARGNCDHCLGHDIQNRHGERLLTVARDGVDDFAFRYQAGDCITAFHHQSRDAPLSHPISGAFDRLGRADRYNVGAIAIQNTLNAHEHSPILLVTSELAVLLRCPPGRRSSFRAELGFLLVKYNHTSLAGSRLSDVRL
ncbi:MAG TPA: hypothetical protein VKP67_11525 [Xanthobacteraceae bacterium]|nr:hypothetical protein [Xanthobacteraceae bacterium]